MAELWDIYAVDGSPKGLTRRRGDTLAEGDYHLVVFAWILDSAGRVVLTRRHPDKPYPGFWECTGGSALAGEGSEEAALRELREEIGVEFRRGEGRHLLRYIAEDSICDQWLFRRDLDLGETRLQASEVTAIRHATPAELRALFEAGEAVPAVGPFLDLLPLLGLPL